MSAELITGRELNVEAARYYAQTNQTGKLAETIRKDIGTAAEFQKMGRIESQMLAQAYGLSRESLAEMLINGEMLNRLNVSDTDELYKQYAAGKLSLDQIKKRGSEELAQQMKNMSFQERLNSLIEKAKDLFVNQLSKKGGPIDRFTKSLDKWISGGGIDRLVSKLQTAAEMFGKAISYLTDPTVLKILGVVAGISVAKKVLNMIRPLGSKSNPMYVRLD